MKKRKLIKEDNNLFYLYNPIPIVKQEAVIVIQTILRTHGISYQFGETVDLNELDVVNRMRFENYIDRLIQYKEIRGHTIEGLMAGLFDGTLNTNKSGIWDYEVSQGKIEQKYLEKDTESPSIGGFTTALNNLGPEVKKEIKYLLETTYGRKDMNLFMVNDDSLTLYKKNILEAVLTDITAITFNSGDRLKTFYLTKNQAIDLFSDMKNVREPRKLGSNELRVSSAVLKDNGSSFDIIKPVVSDDEKKPYLDLTKEDRAIAKIFGPYSGKIRPDILNWIQKNKEQFKDLVNSLL